MLLWEQENAEHGLEHRHGSTKDSCWCKGSNVAVSVRLLQVRFRSLLEPQLLRQVGDEHRFRLLQLLVQVKGSELAGGMLVLCGLATAVRGFGGGRHGDARATSPVACM